MNPKPPAGLPADKAKRRKLLIWGGMAAAIVLALLLARRSQAQQSAAQNAAGQQPQPVANPAADPGLGSGSNGIDYGPQLATIDTDLQTLSSQLGAGVTAKQTPGGSLGELLASELAGVGLYRAGQRNGSPAGGHKHNHHQPKPRPHRRKPPPPHGEIIMGGGGKKTPRHRTPVRPSSRAYKRHG